MKPPPGPRAPGRRADRAGSQVSRRNRLRHLRPRLQLLLFAPGLAAAVVATVLIAYFVPRLLREAAVDGVAATLDLVVPRLAPELGRAPEELQEIVVGWMTSSGDRLTIIGADGTVLADSSLSREGVRAMDDHSERPEVSAALARGEGTSVRRSSTTDITYAYAARVVYGQGGRRTVVRLARPVRQMDALAGQLGTILVVTLIGAGIGGAGVALWFRQRLLVPFARLVEEAETLAAGDGRAPITEPPVPELAILARSLNRLSERIHEQIRAKERERELLRHILEGMAEGVLVTDEEGIPVFSNLSLRRLFGLPDEAMTHDLLDLLRHQEIHLLLRRGREGEQGSLELDWRSRVLEISVLPLEEERGILMVVRDRTEEARLTAMRRDFVANLSHELKTPLAVIRGAAETLQDTGAEDPESLDLFSHRIVEQCYRLEDLLKDLLTLARLENPEASGRRSAVDLGNVTRRAAEQLRPLADRRGVDISLELEEPAVLQGDARALERMVLNLLSNAIKYNRSGGWVRLAVRVEETTVELSVRDGGLGIPRSELSRIFERFYRVDKGRSREEGGSGLGLAIVKHVAQGHGGEVTVESTVGEGSAFTVRLPRIG